ncbi:hypothetical protein [Caudoviricetes sp.]|nr:hypothetical protein [Caudoviricetes sp.]
MGQKWSPRQRRRFLDRMYTKHMQRLSAKRALQKCDSGIQ